MHNDRENIERLSREIDKVLNHELGIANSIKICDHTPQILQQLGLEDLPILMSQNHVRNCLHAKGKNPHWHGLNKSDLVGLIEQLQAPALVMDSLNNDYSIIAVTSTVDKDKLPIIATIRCYGEGQYELATLQSNYLTSVYGKERFRNFLDNHVQENTLLYVDKEKVQRLEQFSQPQLLRTYSFCFGHSGIIRQSSNVCQAAAYAETHKNSSKLKTPFTNAECEDIDINSEADAFNAYLDDVNDRAAEENHIVRQAQQNMNNNKKENGNEHD